MNGETEAVAVDSDVGSNHSGRALRRSSALLLIDMTFTFLQIVIMWGDPPAWRGRPIGGRT
jgi:hypothetical protein